MALSPATPYLFQVTYHHGRARLRITDEVAGTVTEDEVDHDPEPFSQFLLVKDYYTGDEGWALWNQEEGRIDFRSSRAGGYHLEGWIDDVKAPGCPAPANDALYFPWVGPALVAPGALLEVPVHALNHSNLLGLSMNMRFDPAVFEYAGATVAGTRTEGSVLPPVIGATENSVAVGVIYSYACPPSVPPGDGAVVLVQLRVKPDAPCGVSHLELVDAAPTLNRFTDCGGATLSPELAAAEVRIAPSFIRGHVDLNDEVNISDPIFLLAYQFAGGPAPRCLDAADVDDSGEINISDAIYLLAWMFQGGPPPAAPFPTCGIDPTEDDLDCECFEPCGTDCGKLVTEAVPAGEVAGPNALRLGEPSVGKGGLLVAPVILEAAFPLSGLEFRLDFDPTALQFVEMRDGEVAFAYRGAHEGEGTIRAGGVVDLSMSQPLPAGKYLVGEVAFSTMSAMDAGSLRLHSGLLVTSSGSVVQVPSDERDTPPTHGSNSLRWHRMSNPYRAGEAVQLALSEGPFTVQVGVLDVQGRSIRQLFRGEASGLLELRWDGRTEEGNAARSGVYYLRASDGESVVVAKLLYLR